MASGRGSRAPSAVHSKFPRDITRSDLEYDDFVQHLYRENTSLRTKLHVVERDVFNQSNQIDLLEDQIKQLKLSNNNNQNDRSYKGESSVESLAKYDRRRSVAVAMSEPSQVSNMFTKELEETKVALERKSNEVKQLKEEMTKMNDSLQKQTKQIETLEKDLSDAKEEIQVQKQKRLTRRSSLSDDSKKESASSNAELLALQKKFDEEKEANQRLKKQMTNIINEMNRRHSEQQNQLQGVEQLMDTIRREYEEFFEITKADNEVARKHQLEELEKVRTEYEAYRHSQFEEKRRIIQEYQSLLYSMQNQFEEYRCMSEYLFNGELAKIEDELATVTLRYEQEILYIIQAKDKFYTDMMVAKDAKIMHLIEGSDLQSLLKKHELDIENVRKDNLKEIERVKSDQESEQKNLVSLLQRQNQSLEAKVEKVQAHAKTLETKIKDITNMLETKQRQLLDRDSEKRRLEEDHGHYVEKTELKIKQLSLEKEHLRHKVIRLNFSARGEGADSVENILKRLTREQNELSKQYEDMIDKYGGTSKRNDSLSKKLREKEKLVGYLEQEVKKRNREYEAMVKTFEVFLQSRTKQNAIERKERMKRLVQHAEASKRHPAPAPDLQPETQRNVEIERGYAYLKRFKTLSRAFVTGDFRKVQITRDIGAFTEMTGPWQNYPLYSKLDDITSEASRLYEASKRALLPDVSRPTVYQPNKIPVNNPTVAEPSLKVYSVDSSLQKNDVDLKHFKLAGSGLE